MAGRVRAVTINTWKGDGPYRARMRALVEGLANLAPGVVALQESLMSEDGSFDTAGVLADALSMQRTGVVTRGKFRDVEGERVPSWSGPAVLSRWPIVRREVLSLPSDGRDGERVALFCGIESPWGRMQVIATHLTHLRNRSDLRRKQAEAILESGLIDEAACLRLLCGDFNSTPDSAAVNSILVGNSEWVGADLCAAVPGGTAPTMSSRNPHVRAGVESRIDYLFALVRPTEPAPSVGSAGVVLDQPSSEGVYPSDHFGIAATVNVPVFLPAGRLSRTGTGSKA